MPKHARSAISFFGPQKFGSYPPGLGNLCHDEEGATEVGVTSSAIPAHAEGIIS